MYEVHLSQRSKKFIDKLDSNIKGRIINKLKDLSKKPHPSNSKFIARDDNNDKIYRYRIGKYRALYKVKNKDKIILISKVEKRPRVYRRNQ